MPLHKHLSPEEVRVLIVEDHDHTRLMFSALLEDRGYHVTATATAGEALAAIELVCPLCVVLDLGLPDMHGVDLARLLRARQGSGLVIVAVTAYSDKEIHANAEAAGVDFILEKPIELKQFETILPIVKRDG